MRTINEFLTECREYYGESCFGNEKIARESLKILYYIKPGDLAAVYGKLTELVPSKFSLDKSEIMKAVKFSKVEILHEPYSARKCPVCGLVNTTTGTCPNCHYVAATDGTPEEYRAWWDAWRRGEVERFDLSGIFAKLSGKGV